RVSNVFPEDEREIALAGQTDAAVPEGKQLEEALHPLERPSVEFDVKPSGDLVQERCLRRCHPSASRDGIADEHHAWPGCERATMRFTRYSSASRVWPRRPITSPPLSPFTASTNVPGSSPVRASTAQPAVR